MTLMVMCTKYSINIPNIFLCFYWLTQSFQIKVSVRKSLYYFFSIHKISVHIGRKQNNIILSDFVNFFHRFFFVGKV